MPENLQSWNSLQSSKEIMEEDSLKICSQHPDEYVLSMQILTALGEVVKKLSQSFRE